MAQTPTNVMPIPTELNFHQQFLCAVREIDPEGLEGEFIAAFADIFWDSESRREVSNDIARHFLPQEEATESERRIFAWALGEKFLAASEAVRISEELDEAARQRAEIIDYAVAFKAEAFRHKQRGIVSYNESPGPRIA